MKTFILRPKKDLGEDNPWEPWYDKNFGFVINADTEKEARKIAQENGADETYMWNAWIDENYSTCVELSKESKGIIMKDFASA